MSKLTKEQVYEALSFNGDKVDPKTLSREDFINFRKWVEEYKSDQSNEGMHNDFGLVSLMTSSLSASKKIFDHFAPDVFDLTQFEELDSELAWALSPLRCTLSLPNVTAVDDDTLKTLMTDDCKLVLSKKRYIYHCLELGLQSIDPKIAAILNGYNGQISLPNLESIDVKSATKLRGVQWNLLLGIETIDAETAKSLVDLTKKSLGRCLYFTRLNNCPAEILREFSAMEPCSHGDANARAILTLPLEELESEQAKALAARNGGFDSFKLPQLRSASAEILSIICDSMDEDGAYGRSVEFDSLKCLDSASAEVLGTCAKTGWLSLGALKHLDPGVAEQLAKYKGATMTSFFDDEEDTRGVLQLNGLVSLSPEDAKYFGGISVVDYLGLDGLEHLEHEAAAELSKFARVLSLSGLRSINDETAKELVEHQDNLHLNEMVKLSENGVKILESKKGRINGEDPSKWADITRKNMGS